MDIIIKESNGIKHHCYEVDDPIIFRHGDEGILEILNGNSYKIHSVHINYDEKTRHKTMIFEVE